MPLTDRQRALLQLISQLNQNLISDTLGLVDFDLDLGLDLGISLGGNNGNTPHQITSQEHRQAQLQNYCHL